MDTGEFWQLHNTYILAQTKSGLIIVDQHVAHERIIYESIMKGKQDGQRLLFPITLELTPEEYRVYKNTKPILKQFGVEFKEFSARTIIIDSLPTYAQVNREEIVGLFNEINGLGNLMKQKSEIAKVLACRSAIKAGQKLAPGEMQDLIDKLFACENPYTCPHGRPIILKFSLEDLGVRFGRE
jgi:DNA mismatch repair protein MutL